jgi:hypothetical protein
MTDVEAARDPARRHRPEHGHALEDGVAVAGELTFGGKRWHLWHRGDKGSGRFQIIDPLDQQIALRIHFGHG